MDYQENPETTPPVGQALMDRFRTGNATIGVVGLGYVGLPLAVVLAQSGYKVVGVDLDHEKVATISRGESYVEDVPAERLGPLVDQGQITVSDDYDALKVVDGVSICVPTPLRKTGDPDLSFILNTIQSLLPALHAGMVVILESTTYPGTTREMLLPEFEEAGFNVGEDLFLAFSPERVDPGREDWTTENTPKIVGGITSACSEVAAAMYGHAMDTIVKVSSTEVAEMAKLLENTFRAVNIAMVNEMALICNRLGIDVWEVIDAAATKPFGFMKFTPGPGWGGHCIPIDPLYLSWKLKSVKYNARFIDLASEINTNMPRYVVQRVQDAMNEQGKAIKGSSILVLGVAYKPDVSDVRESPALDVIGLFRSKEAIVSYYDPHVPSIEHDDWDMTSVEDMESAVQEADCVVIVTDHTAVDYSTIASKADLIFDSRNVMTANGIYSENIVRM
ncbi:MAG: nucleotide sugar dehydrogenase [Anaerolineales bacterium]|nr:nucleotide sugar dehydrogenase [Anaerolineales bacterium]